MHLASAFGRRLKELRSLKLMTQTQLAQHCGISMQYLGRLERGLASPSFNVLEHLCAALDVDAASLFLSPQLEGDAQGETVRPVSQTAPAVGVWRRNSQTGTDTWSQSLLTLLGYGISPDTIAPDFFLKHVHQQDREKVRQFLDLSLAGGVAPGIHCRLLRKNGGQRFIRIHAEHFMAAHGVLVEVCLVIQDMTETWRYEQALLETGARLEAQLASQDKELAAASVILDQHQHTQTEIEHRLHIADMISEAVNDALAFVSNERIYTFVNRRYEEISGLTRQEILGKTVRQLLGEDYYERYAKHHLDRGLKGEPVRYQAWYNSPVYGQRYMDITYTPYRHKGQASGVVMAVHDITDLHAADHIIREREERFRLMVENMPVLLHAHDAQGLYVFWNKESERVSGYSADEIVGNPNALELLYPDKQYRDKVFAPAHDLDHAFENRTLQLTAKDGATHIIAWSNLSPLCPVPGWPYWEVGIDITEQIRAEEALRASNELFAKAFDSDHVAVAVSRSSDGTYLDANPGFLKMTGYDYDEIVGKTSRELQFFSENQRRELVRDIEAHGGLRDRELVFRAKSGERRTILYSISPVLLDSEPCYIGTMVDITGRKLAEEAFKQSEAYLRAVFEATRDLVCTRDVQGRLVRCNQAFADFVADFLGVDALPGLRTMDYLPAEVGKYWMDALDRVMAGDPHRETMQVEIGQEQRYFDLFFGPILQDGKPIGTAEFTHEITHIKQAEAALRQSEARYRALFEKSSEGIFLHDLTGNILDANEAAQKMFGYSLEELRQLRPESLVHPDEAASIAREFSAIVRDEFHSATHRCLRKDGSEILVITRGKMVSDTLIQGVMQRLG